MFDAELQQFARQHLLRELRVIESASGPVISMAGQDLIHFSSNDYLGLANHPSVRRAAIQAIEIYGVGAGASRLIAGTMTPHDHLERELAHWKGVEACLTFSSGYAASTGIIPILAKAEGIILADRLCHASLIDGCRLSRASLRIFHHNDLDHLHRLLKKHARRAATLIVTEGVFSMDGDVAPLEEIVKLAQEFSATLFVDDAHGTGVMGKTGRGTIEHFELDPREIFQMGTLSKAIGTSGGFVVGPNTFISYLINTCRPFIYTTAPPPAIAAAAAAAIAVIQEEPQRRAQLWKNREQLFTGLTGMGFQLTSTQSPILPILVNDPETGMQMSRCLKDEGIWIPVVRPPTVPKGTSRLRMTVTAAHTPEHIERALQALRKVGIAFHCL